MSTSLVWFRRDLRSHDHAALAQALAHSDRVYCVFVFDRTILDAQPPDDRRVAFIHASVAELAHALECSAHKAGGSGGLIVRHGHTEQVIPALALSLGADTVWCNRDYEPDAVRRDAAVADALTQLGAELRSCKDQVIFEKGEVLTRAQTPFSVFTPYARAWRAALGEEDPQPFDCTSRAHRLAPPPEDDGLPTLEALGFSVDAGRLLRVSAGMSGAQALVEDFSARIGQYQARRDFPARKGPSYLSVHLRFGTVSVRQLVTLARSREDAGARSWLNELIWREFYQMILWFHPRVVRENFRPEFDAVCWEDWPEGLQRWCAGQTGYPLVDAGMRQLAQTGYMHNRLRMVTASFLSKDLGLHWLAGERHFAALLNDYDLASNNGGWQWAASTGCDAQPWFRIFNPVTQSQRFDPDGAFIRRYVPELQYVPDKAVHAPWRLPVAEQQRYGVLVGRDYPAPIVDHAQARERTLARFSVVKKAAR